MKQRINSKNPEDTKMIAKMLLRKWLFLNRRKNSNWLICLSGELGSGKTAFAKFLCEELGVKSVVSSPTFLIMKKYKPFKKANKKYNIYHFDCYRVRNAKEILDLGWEDILFGENNIIVVEWPEKIEEILPKKRLNIRFEIAGESSRRIELS